MYQVPPLFTIVSAYVISSWPGGVAVPELACPGTFHTTVAVTWRGAPPARAGAPARETQGKCPLLPGAGLPGGRERAHRGRAPPGLSREKGRPRVPPPP